MFGKVALIILCLLATLSCGRREWKKFRSDDGGFTVDMPGKPEVAVHKNQTGAGPIALRTFRVTLENGAVVYMVAYNDYQQAMISSAKPDAILDSVVLGAVEKNRQKIKFQGPTQLRSFPGRDLQANVKGGWEYTSRFFLVGARLYQVSVVNEPGRASAEDKHKFLDSFDLLQDKK
jgi:hypothetical protein